MKALLRHRRRWHVRGLLLLPTVAAAMLALPAGASAAFSSEPGPLPVGNLLNYPNSDFEGQINFIAVSNATISQSSTGFLHSHSLQDTVGSVGTSVFRLRRAVAIPVSGGSRYTLSAYVKLSSAAGGQTLRFSLGCYTSGGTFVAPSSAPTMPLVGETSWQYVESYTTLPPACEEVVGSPKLTLGGMAAGEVVNVDALTFRPHRAALVIGAHGNIANGGTSTYTATDWLDTNNLLGPLQSDNFFFAPTKPLPSSWSSSANNCYEIEQSLPRWAWPECVIAYRAQESEAQLQSFLAGLPAGQQLVMVWWTEPEAASFSGCPGATGDGPNFVCYFKRQASEIRQAAAADGVSPQVLVGMSASTYAYDPTSDPQASDLEADDWGNSQTGTSCSFIPPSSSVDVYLADHYALNATSDLTAGPGERADNWQNWLTCVLPNNKPIGLGEYGLNPNDSNPAGTASAIIANRKYLEGLPATTHEETALWALWDSLGADGTRNWAIDDEAAAIRAWQAGETQNGGG